MKFAKNTMVKIGFLSLMIAAFIASSVSGIIGLVNPARYKVEAAQGNFDVSATSLIKASSGYESVVTSGKLSWTAGYQDPYYGKTAYGVTDTRTGLLINRDNDLWNANDSTWSVDINGVFKGNSEIEYSFPLLGLNDIGITAFGIKDLNGNELFYVGRTYFGGFTYTSITNGTGYVYDDVTGKYWSLDENAEKVDITADVTYNGNHPAFINRRVLKQNYILPVPQSGIAKDSAEDDKIWFSAKNIGKLVLEFTDDNKVNVKVTVHNKGEVTMATLDSTAIKDGYTVSIYDKRVCNTPKEDANGEKIGWTYNTVGHPVVITAINGVSTADENVTATADTDDLEIFYEGEKSVNGKSLIVLKINAQANFTCLAKNVQIGSLTLPDVEKTFSGDIDTTVVGEKSVVVSAYGVSKTYTVKVLNQEAVNTVKLIKASSGYESVAESGKLSWTAGYQDPYYGERKGLFINSDGIAWNGNGTMWSADVNGVFKGNAEIEYSFPLLGKDVGVTAFGVNDLNGNELFYVGRTYCNSNVYGLIDNGTGYVYDDSTGKYWSLDENAQIMEITESVAVDGEPTFATTSVLRKNKILPAPQSGSKAEDATKQTFSAANIGKLIFEITDDNKVNVKVTVSGKGEVTMATLDATALKDGYTVSIYDKRVKTNYRAVGSPVIITAINGVSTAGETVETALTTGRNVYYDGEKEQDGKNIINLTKGANLEEFKVDVVNAVKGLSLTGEKAGVYSFAVGEDFSEKPEGEYPLTIKFGDQSKDYTIVVEAEKVTISYTVAGVEQTERVEKGSLFETENLNPTLEGKTFIGWKISGALKKTDYSFTANEDVTMEAVFAEFGIMSGAGVRRIVTQDAKGGLRFIAFVNSADITDLTVEYGVLLSVGEVESTVESAGAKAVKAVNVFKDSSAQGLTGYVAGRTYYCATIEGIPVANYETKVSARAYLKVTYDGGASEYFYSDYDAKNNARSVKEVAKAALDNGESDPEGVLNNYVNGRPVDYKSDENN